MLLISMREKDHLNSQFIVDNKEKKIPEVVINSADASKYDVKSGDIVELHSEVGIVQACIFFSKEALLGTVGMSHGFELLGNVSELTSSEDVNPLSGMVTQTGIKIEIKKIGK
jgi:anaerobic selenocysteine-containing dehydrogenase